MSIDEKLHIISFELTTSNIVSKWFIRLLVCPKLIDFILFYLPPDIISTPYGSCDAVIF